MIGAERGAERPARIARRRLNPNLLEEIRAQQLSVRDAVERDAAGKAEPFLRSLLRDTARERDNNILAYALDRGGEVHFLLRQQFFRFARRSAKQRVEPRIGHRQAGAIVEIVHVEVERAVVSDVDQVVSDDAGIFGLAVGREAHHLVFARVDLEPGVVGEGRVQQPERMREVNFLCDRERIAGSRRKRRRRPFADAVHRQDRRVLVGRGKKRRRRVTDVMLGEQDFSRLDLHAVEYVGQRVADQRFLKQLVLDPHRHRRRETLEAPRRKGEIGLENALEFRKRLVIENKEVDVLGREAPLGETEPDRVYGKARVGLEAGEAFLLRRGDDVAVHDQAGRGIVIVGRDA